MREPWSLLATHTCCCKQAREDSLASAPYCCYSDQVTENQAVCSGSCFVPEVPDIPVVDHFLIPHPIVKRPDDDQPGLIAGGELIEGIVPCSTHDCPSVAFQRLILCQSIASCSIG